MLHRLGDLISTSLSTMRTDEGLKTMAMDQYLYIGPRLGRHARLDEHLPGESTRWLFWRVWSLHAGHTSPGFTYFTPKFRLRVLSVPWSKSTF